MDSNGMEKLNIAIRMVWILLTLYGLMQVLSVL